MNTISRSIISQTERFTVFGLILASVVMGAALAQAGSTVPWKSASHGQLTPTEFGYPYFAVAETGVATHVGKFTETGTPTLVDPSDPTKGVVTLIEITAANGDKLLGIITDVSGAPPFVQATILIYDGTGRFKGAAGIYDATLTIDMTTLEFTATSTGSISTVGSKKK